MQMKTKSTRNRWLKIFSVFGFSMLLMSSSHREAPMIANDPYADNTDLYAFRSPQNPNKIIIIANFIPGEAPQGGPNYYTFSENVRYEVHIDNKIGRASCRERV